MMNLTGPTVGSYFMRLTSIVNITRHSFFQFSPLILQLKSANIHINAKRQTVLTDDDMTILSMTPNSTKAFIDHLSEWNTECTETLLVNFIETGSLLE